MTPRTLITLTSDDETVHYIDAATIVACRTVPAAGVTPGPYVDLTCWLVTGAVLTLPTVRSQAVTQLLRVLQRGTPHVC